MTQTSAILFALEKSEAYLFLPISAADLEVGDINSINEIYKEHVNKEVFAPQPSMIRALDVTKSISWWNFVSNQSDHNMLAMIAAQLLNIVPSNASVGSPFRNKSSFIERRDTFFKNKVSTS